MVKLYHGQGGSSIIRSCVPRIPLATGGEVAAQHLWEDRLADRAFPGVQSGNLVGVGVSADDVMAKGGEDGGSRQADVTDTDDTEVQPLLP